MVDVNAVRAIGDRVTRKLVERTCLMALLLALDVGKPVWIRFEMKDATVYSFSFKE